MTMSASLTVNGVVVKLRCLRENFQYSYSRAPFGTLPLWAHAAPIVIAQFHTLLCVIILMNGLPYVLGPADVSRSSVGTFY